MIPNLEGALCAQMPAEMADRIFFPGRTTVGVPAAAARLCATCPVRGACLSHAENMAKDLDVDRLHLYGIFGGKRFYAPHEDGHKVTI
jgi:hypothetical protein